MFTQVHFQQTAIIRPREVNNANKKKTGSEAENVHGVWQHDSILPQQWSPISSLTVTILYIEAWKNHHSDIVDLRQGHTATPSQSFLKIKQLIAGWESRKNWRDESYKYLPRRRAIHSMSARGKRYTINCLLVSKEITNWKHSSVTDPMKTDPVDFFLHPVKI